MICSYVLSDCKTRNNEFSCLSTCESVWFKIWNATASGSLVEGCDKVFFGQYGNVMWELICISNVGRMIVRVDKPISLCM